MSKLNSGTQDVDKTTSGSGINAGIVNNSSALVVTELQGEITNLYGIHVKKLLNTGLEEKLVFSNYAADTISGYDSSAEYYERKWTNEQNEIYNYQLSGDKRMPGRTYVTLPGHTFTHSNRENNSSAYINILFCEVDKGVGHIVISNYNGGNYANDMTVENYFVELNEDGSLKVYNTESA